MLDSNQAFMAGLQIRTIDSLNNAIKEIERQVLSRVKMRKAFEMLKTIPGIGNILGLTIMLEVGDINRFAKVGCYSSYCRCVKSEKISNGKKKGKNNTRNGNKYLGWAYVEAANFAKRYCPEARKFFQRKNAQRNGIVATKALSNKICRASYYIMRDQLPFDEVGLFCR